jgi:hypothetical protein
MNNPMREDTHQIDNRCVHLLAVRLNSDPTPAVCTIVPQLPITELVRLFSSSAGALITLTGASSATTYSH